MYHFMLFQCRNKELIDNISWIGIIIVTHNLNLYIRILGTNNPNYLRK